MRLLGTEPVRKKILIVDDAVENLKLLTGLLEADYILRVAKTGEKALLLLEEDPDIDLVLLDVMMPGGMDGFEVCKRIKSNKLTSAIPVIFLTGLNDSEDETLGLSLGGADYITKPFQSDVVKARIRTHLLLKEETEKFNQLLEILLPRNVIHDLMRNGSYEPTIHNSVSILFCDLVDFTKATTRLSPQELVDELSDLFMNFDRIVEKHGCTRIKTIGDGYMAVSGIEGNVNHANALVECGLEIIDHLSGKSNGAPWKCRIGINSGEAISGIVGKYRFQFDMMGDNVNLAARVERNAPQMVVTATKNTIDLLDHAKYQIRSIGMKELKGKGNIELFSIERPSGSMS